MNGIFFFVFEEKESLAQERDEVKSQFQLKSFYVREFQREIERGKN